jgi:cytidylate kinase
MTLAQFRKTDFLRNVQPQGDSAKKLIIAVDGPAASGKGTLAYKMAERLNFAYLDTGALYRAVALATLETGGDPTSIDDVAPALQIIKRNITPELLANPALRTPEVSDAASKVATLPEVRLELMEFQRDFANNPPNGAAGAVLDGRDIGTVICPEADIKFYVTAAPEERAKRRFNELQRTNKDTSYTQVLIDLKERDTRDQMRKIAPSIAADNAYIIDTTALSPAETLEEAIAIIRARFLDQTNV